MNLTGAAASQLQADVEGWTHDTVAEVIGQRAVRALDREQVIPARIAARAIDHPHALLTRLFLLGDTLSAADCARALPRLGTEGAAASGLISVNGDVVSAAVDLRPYETESDLWWIASDLGESVTGSRLEADHVLGVGGASLTLASITMRRRVGRALDLGTGSGVQALHAATHADAVVATDISPRALGFAAFNAALNDVTLDLRHGSLLEPVAGEAFDLVVSNPPFVITPPGTPSFEYRDGGMPGDALVGSLVSVVGSVLTPGGVAQMLGNWEIRDGWDERVRQWLDASPVPLDAWVVQRDQLDAAEYAETWLRDAGVIPERGRAAFDDAYEAYLADFDRRGVESIGLGMILVRRASGTPWVRIEEFEGPVAAPLGPTLIAALEAHDRLVALTDQALLDERFTVAADVTRETYGRPLLTDPEHILIRQGGGFGRSIRADTALAGFVGACDGELTVGQIAHALSALLDVPAGQMMAGLVPAVRDMVTDGFLV